jgi:putative tryptophan/tyrosine transport system substrate-binding protein
MERPNDRARDRLSRRQLVRGAGAAGLGLLAGCVRLPWQAPPPSVARIGFLASSSPEAIKTRVAAFQQGLRELGYVEGKDLTIEYRYAEGEYARLPELAAELVRLEIKVLVVEGAIAAYAARDTTTVIPIVIGNAADPVGAGLVASLARPGGNITGLSTLNVSLTEKRLELLKEVVPSASRVAVFLNPADPTTLPQLREIQAAAPVLGVTLLPLEIQDPDDIDRAFAAIGSEHAGALLVFASPTFRTHQRRIAELAAESRLPAIYGSRESVDAGGLMSYGTRFEDLYRRAAYYVDRILKGTKPADLPVEQPMTFEFVVNMKTAQALGITFPNEIMLQVTEVIQ